VGRCQPSRAAQTIAHTVRRETAALRDFSPAFVRFGSKADITLSIGYVRFTPQSGLWLL